MGDYSRFDMGSSANLLTCFPWVVMHGLVKQRNPAGRHFFRESMDHNIYWRLLSAAN